MSDKRHARLPVRYGDVRQIGLVVRDAHRAMRHWAATMGVGPFFFVERATFDNYRYRGMSAPSPVCTFGYAQAGPLQIEIIQQHNDTPSGYLDFLAAGREGCQHLSSWCADRPTFDRACSAAVEGGAQIMHQGTANDAPFAYFDAGTAAPYGLAFEIAMGLAPALEPIHALLHAASEGWDGRDPVRPFPQ